MHTTFLKRNGEEIFMQIPQFDSASKVEALGFTGGIAVLWNSLHYTFITVANKQRALHGVIEGKPMKTLCFAGLCKPMKTL